MRADELIARFSMEAHPEHGLFIERHYEASGDSRPASGCIYYYVAPGERTEFHRIDCDEYWCFNAGSALELWIIDLEGDLHVKRCGLGPGAEPAVRFAAGEIFASRLPENAADGSFITCITVPRFTYDGFEMIDRASITAQYPETAGFWD